MSNAYQTDLPKKVDFVDEVERWKIRWIISHRDYSTLYMQQTVTYTGLYPESSVSY